MYLQNNVSQSPKKNALPYKFTALIITHLQAVLKRPCDIFPFFKKVFSKTVSDWFHNCTAEYMMYLYIYYYLCGSRNTHCLAVRGNGYFALIRIVSRTEPHRTGNRTQITAFGISNFIFFFTSPVISPRKLKK